MTEMINVSSITVETTGNTKTPNVISTQQANQEEWESVLVRLNGATVTANNQPVFQFTVNDGSGGVFVDDLLYVYAMPTVGQIFNLTGPMFFSFTERKILPRAVSDMQNITSVDEWTSSVSVYPNPVVDVLQVEALQGTFCKLYAADGKLVDEFTTTGTMHTYNAANLATGMYVLQLTNGNASKSFSVVKQ
jgi:hypothetical protein